KRRLRQGLISVARLNRKRRRNLLRTVGAVVVWRNAACSKAGVEYSRSGGCEKAAKAVRRRAIELPADRRSRIFAGNATGPDSVRAPQKHAPNARSPGRHWFRGPRRTSSNKARAGNGYAWP